MIHYVKGDLLESDCDYICHQVNCQGKMNSGVAKAIREKWPVVYDNYKKKCEEREKAIYEMSSSWETMPDWSETLLGDIQIVALYDDYYATKKHQHVVNFFSQQNYGYDHQRYTSYDAFWNCLFKLKECAQPNATIAFPYKIGCVRGGADWDVIETMIIKMLQGREVYFYYLDENILESQDKFVCLFCNNNYIMTMEGKNEQENN